MKHHVLYGLVFVIYSSFFNCLALQAQSLKDLLGGGKVSEVVDALTGKKQKLNLEGTWNYKGSACEFKTDNLLKKAGGAVAASTLEGKMDEYCSQIGIEKGEFGYTFASDSTFTNTYRGKKFTGTYSVNPETSEICLRYFRVLPIRGVAKMSGNNLSLLFDADKLLKLLTAISTKSSSSTISTIGKIADGYDGLRLGFDLNK